MKLEGNVIRRTALALAAVLTVLAGCATSEPSVVPAAPAPEAVQTEYRIGPGDQLNIFVWNHPELSLSVPVRPDGLLSTPLVENVKAEGKTPSQLGKDLEAAMGEYVRGPKVNVIVTAGRGARDQVTTKSALVSQSGEPASVANQVRFTASPPSVS